MASCGVAKEGFGEPAAGPQELVPQQKYSRAKRDRSFFPLGARTLPRALPSPQARRSRSGHSPVPVSADLSEAKRLPFRAPPGCAPEQTRTRLRRAPPEPRLLRHALSGAAFGDCSLNSYRWCLKVVDTFREASCTERPGELYRTTRVVQIDLTTGTEPAASCTTRPGDGGFRRSVCLNHRERPS